jgi:multidrug efflux pump subunit AcrB
MKITEFSVKNYQFTIVIFIMVLGLGLSSLFNMPRGEDPAFAAPTSIIVAVYPGASPKDVEKLVADPIEKKMKELNDIKKIKSSIDDGLCVTSVEFNYGSDIDSKYNDVVREVNAIRSSLPDELLSLDINKVNASDVNTYQAALISQSAGYKQMFDEADRLKKELEKIPEVKKVKISGYPEQQVRVSIDLEKMAQNKIPLNRALGSVQAGAVSIPGGSIDAGGKRFNIKTTGDYSSLNDIRNTPVFTNKEQVVYLKDIASVEFCDEDQSYYTRYNGKRAIFVSVNEKERTNILQVHKKAEPVFASFAKSLPANIQFENGFVQAQDVDKRLNHFLRDFSIAILLVILTLMPLGWRASLVVMISIPLSISIGLVLLNALGYTINQLSIVGMIIALGLLVDDSIVVVENIERFLRNGFSRAEAAIKATSQISKAVMGATATLILAFLPIVFLPEASGDFIRSLPVSVTATVFASFFVSVTIVPFLSSMILSRHENPNGNIVLRSLQKLINITYRPLLNKAVKKPYITLAAALGLFLASLFLFKVIGFSLFPRSEKPMFLVNIETPLGTNTDKTDRAARYVEEELGKRKDIDRYFSNVGKGNPMVYYNEPQKNEAANFAQIFVRMKNVGVPEIEKTVDELRNKFNNFPDAKIEVKQFEQGPPVDAPVAIRIFGDNLDTLRNIACMVENVIKNTDGTIYVNNPLQTFKTDIKLNINKDKAAMLGVSTNEIDRTVRLGIAGLNAASYRDEKGDKYKINVTLSHDKRQTMDVFDKLYVTSQAGILIPVSQLASPEFETTIPTIKHYNNSRYIVVTSQVKNGYNTREVTKTILNKLGNTRFPTGFTYTAAGEVESSQESLGGLGSIILITVFGFLGVLLLEFRTFKGSLIVLSVIPLGIIGAVTILFLTGNNLSFVSVVGFIALAGIEVKNSILLVDYTNHLRGQGLELDRAIEEAGETRFLPIILTTATAIGGLVPLIMESSPLYSPLAWVLIGGLITSTALTRLVTPVLYKLLPPEITIK